MVALVEVEVFIPLQVVGRVNEQVLQDQFDDDETGEYQRGSFHWMVVGKMKIGEHSQTIHSGYHQQVVGGNVYPIILDLKHPCIA